MATFEKIATVDVPAGGSVSIEFTNIPSTYTHFIAFSTVRHDGTNVNSAARINNDSSSTTYIAGQSWMASNSVQPYDKQVITGLWTRFLWSPGTDSGNSSSASAGHMVAVDYSGSYPKNFHGDGVAPRVGCAWISAYWPGTNAVTQFNYYPLFNSVNTAKFVENSRMSLYGLKTS